MLNGREVEIAGSPAVIFGDINDMYFQVIEHMAHQLKPLISLVSQSVSSDARILDVGANIGISAIALSRTRPNAEIFAFEPSPANVAMLKENLKANGIANVTVVAAALSNKKGFLPFHESQYGAGSHIVSSDHLTQGLATTSVPIKTLDDFIEEIGGVMPSFIKIDAEGHEPNILAGASKLIQRDNPLIYMEFNSWCLNAFGGHSPAAFARSIFKYFDVMEQGAENSLIQAAGSDPYQFLHRNLTQHGCVDDLILRLRAGSSVPPLEEMTWPTDAYSLLIHQHPVSDVLSSGR